MQVILNGDFKIYDYCISFINRLFSKAYFCRYDLKIVYSTSKFLFNEPPGPSSQIFKNNYGFSYKTPKLHSMNNIFKVIELQFRHHKRQHFSQQGPFIPSQFLADWSFNILFILNLTQNRAFPYIKKKRIGLQLKAWHL